MNEPSCDASSRYAGASSSGWPGRASATSWPKCSTLSAGIVTGMFGVHTGPGTTQLTRMPRSASDSASDLVKAWIAPFDAV